MKKSLLLRIVKAIIPCFSLLFTASLFNQSLAQNVTGKVFRDFNANGLQTVSNPIEPGVPGVIVKVFRADGTQVGANQTTALDGSYSVSVGNTNEYRIEFSNFPTAFFSGPKGTGSNTSTQFVKGGTIANLGINYPSDYCGTTDPQLVTPCYINGTPITGGNGANEPAIVSIPYTPTGNGSTLPVGTNPSENIYLAKGVDVGATWGMAYQRSSKFIFTSALLKRHSGLGTGGPGAIYKIDNSSGTPSTTLFVDLNADLGVSAGTNPRDPLSEADSIPRFKNQPSRDEKAFGLVGKMALGDLDISDDEKSLWVINTFDRKLYELPIGSPAVKPTTKIAHTLPNPGCTNGVFRPWAVKFWRGKVYVGGVCTAENAGGTAADLKAYIYSFMPNDPNPDNFTEVYNFKLDYPRGSTSIDGTKATSAAWKPWIATWSDITNPTPDAGAYGQTICPQPMLSDIEFDVDGSMILGFMDRAGHQLGSNNYSTLSTDFKTGSTTERNLYEGTSAGDLLRVGLNPDGVTYTLEKDATVNGVISGGKGQSPSQGPGTGEFYWQDMYRKNADKNLPTVASGGGHQEISLGGIALFPGKNEVVETVFDPVNAFRAGGVRWFNNTTGEVPRAYEIFGQDAGGLGVTFGKANGLGDLELLCASQPIEVGNRIWNDTDKDGIQDAGEPVLTGVTVELWKGGVKIDTKTTDAVTGEYYFTGLTPNSTDYEIRVPNVNGASKQTTLAGLMPTTANVGTNNEIDSDATVTNTYASIVFTTGNAGENNHSLDFGFKCLTPTAKPNGQNVILCDAISTFDLPDAKTGADAETWRVITSPSTPAAIINATSGVVTGMKTVGKYEFVLTNTATSCTDTVSITVKPMIAAGANQSVCTSTATVNAPSSTQTWSVITKPIGTNPLIATNGNVTGLTANGVYVFRLTDETCFDEVQITKTAGPDAGQDISTCATTATVNSASITETWTPVTSPANPSPATIDAFGDITGMINPGVYQFKLSSDNGCSDIVAVTKTAGVNLTTIDVGVCVGGILQLTANTTNTGLTFSWKGPVGFTSNQQNPSIADISETNMGVYTVTATSSTGCSATATAKVTFTQITVTQLAGFVNQCVGETLTLRDATTDRKPDEIVGAYLWSGPDGFTATTMNITILALPDMKQAGTYSLKVTLTNGCFAVATLNTTITKCQKLGNLVWNDVNNDGLNNNGELGVANVPVKLFDAANPTTSIANTTTGLDGKYLFPNLIPGFYIVEIEAPTGFKTSTGTNASATGPYEPAPDPNSPDTNDTDDGSKTTGQLIRSQIVELDNLTEPQNDGDILVGSDAEKIKQDKNSNLTIDFGIFKASQIGDLVWSDTNKDGIQQITETGGVPNVIVKLFAGNGTTPIATITTDANGNYFFDNVIPGTYTVEFMKSSIGVGNSFSPKGAGTDPLKNSDADPVTGKSSPFIVTEGQKDLGINAGIIGDCPGSTIGTITVPNLCAGQTLTLKATSSDPLATYAWSRTPSGFNATTQEITLPNLTAGTSVYTVLITNSNLCTSALTANVVVNPIPTVSITNAAFCEGASGTITASGATSYAWTGPSGAFTTTTASLSVTQRGVYSVIGTSNGCTANATTSVTVYPKTVLTATGAAICLGGNGTISVLPAGLKYVWTGSAAFSGSTSQTPSILNAKNTDQGIYTVTVTDGNTCVATASVAVTVGTALTVTPTSNSPVCVGTRLDLSITGGTGATYLWTSPQGVTTNVQNPFTQTATLDDKGIWTVAVQNADGCRGTGSVTVDIKPALTGVTAMATAPGCTGDNIILTSSPAGAKSYEWSGTPSFVSSVQNPTIVKPAADNYTFTVKVTNADGCTALATASTAIYTAPAASASSNSAVCVGSPINLSVSTSATQFAWTGPNAFTASSKTPTILKATSAFAGVYTVIVTNVNSCTAIATTNVIVNPLLSGGEDLSICSPVSTAQLTVISGSTWRVEPSNPAPATVDANGKASGLTVNGSYVFYITNASGCNDTVKVFRNEKLDAGDDVVICSPTSTAKLLKTNTGQTWRYFANGSTLPTPTIDVNGNVANVTQDGSYLFILEQLGGTTYCADTVAVIRKPSPMAGNDQTVKTGSGICEPSKTAKLQAAGTNQTWSVASNSVGFGTVAIDASGTITKMETNGIYIFVLTQGECTDSVKVERIASPTFDANAVQATCTIGTANADAKLIISSTDATATYDYNEGTTYTGTKTFATGTAISAPVLGLANPTADKSYTVRVFNRTGCFTDKIVVLKPRICECKPDVCLPYSFRKTK